MEIILIIVLAVALIKLYSRVSALERITQSAVVQPIAPSKPAPSIPVTVAPVAQVSSVDSEIAPIIPPPIPTPETPKKNLEFMTGTRWFTGVGVVLVLLGIGFFFRYAFAHDLISPAFRVLIGMVFGGIFLGLGAWLQKNYRNYGLSLVGVGLGALYISFYAAYAFYSLVPALLSFALMLGIVGVGIYYSVRTDAEQLSATSLIAGYISIILFMTRLPMFGSFVALATMSLVLIAVSYYKHWPRLAALALLFTAFSMVIWVPLSMETSMLMTAILVGALYLVFALSNLINFAKTEGEYSPWQSFSLYATPIIFFIAEVGILDDKKPIALLSFGIAAFYAGLTLLVRSMAPTHVALKKFAEVSRLIFPSFIALGIMTYFDGQVAVLTLAVEGLLVVGSGLCFSNRLQYVVGQIILGISIILSLAFAEEYRGTYRVLLNAPTLTFIGVGVALLASWFAHVFITSDLPEGMRKVFRILASLIAYTFFIGVICSEIFRNVLTLDAAQFAVVGVALLAVGMFTLGIIYREKAIRYGTYVLFVILSLAAITDAFETTPANALLNATIAAMIAVSFLGVFIYRLLRDPVVAGGLENEFSSVRMIPLIGVNLVVFTILTLSVHWHFALLENSAITLGGYAERLSISFLWIIYASIGLVIGLIRRSVFSRQVAAVLFVLATVKILLFDSLELNDLYRFASFITLGVVMLAAGFLYTKFKDRINSFVGLSS